MAEVSTGCALSSQTRSPARVNPGTLKQLMPGSFLEDQLAFSPSLESWKTSEWPDPQLAARSWLPDGR
jgi:hypothetical protein